MFGIFSSASVGIIGGADGPTSILVSVSPEWPMYATGVAAAVLAFILILRKIRKK